MMAAAWTTCSRGGRNGTRRRWGVLRCLFFQCGACLSRAHEASLRASSVALGDDERTSCDLDAALLDHLASVVSLASSRNSVGTAVATARAKVVCKSLQRLGKAQHASAPGRIKLLKARVAWSRGESTRLSPSRVGPSGDDTTVGQAHGFGAGGRFVIMF